MDDTHPGIGERQYRHSYAGPTIHSTQRQRKTAYRTPSQKPIRSSSPPGQFPTLPAGQFAADQAENRIPEFQRREGIGETQSHAPSKHGERAVPPDVATTGAHPRESMPCEFPFGSSRHRQEPIPRPLPGWKSRLDHPGWMRIDIEPLPARKPDHRHAKRFP